MDDAELCTWGDQSFAEFRREQARWLPGYQLREHDSALLVAAGTRFAGGFNCLLPLTAAEPDPQRLLAEAQAFFAPLDRGFSVYAPAHLGVGLQRACEAAGLQALGDAPGMVLRAPLAERPLPSGVVIQKVDMARAADFVAVSARAYESMGLPAAVTHKLFSLPVRWLRPHWHHVVLYQDASPVSAAALLFSHGIAGVYWVGTVPDARAKGHADALMRHVSNYAFDHGARAVFLQASPAGEPLYRKLGYREFTYYPGFLARKAPHER
jgi:ribosomal protein S18 acetylase RimI-like enzyme